MTDESLSINSSPVSVSFRPSSLPPMELEQPFTMPALHSPHRIAENKAMLLEHFVSGRISIAALTSLTPPQQMPIWRFRVSSSEATFPNRSMSVRAMVSTSIGRSQPWWIGRRGNDMPVDSKRFVRVTVYRLIGLELRIYHQCCVLPALTTESTVGKYPSEWEV